jgi:hypothetical protein
VPIQEIRLEPLDLSLLSHCPPASTPAKPPAPGEEVPLPVPAGVGSGNIAASAQGPDCHPVEGFKKQGERQIRGGPTP